MATTKITDLTAYTDPVNTDVLPIVDVTSDVTKKVSIANVMKNASLGTAAAPGIAFDGDPNTGIYSPGADQVAISTGGSGRLFVESNGNIRIGTASSTQSLLHLSASALVDLRFADTGEAADQKNWVWQTGTGVGTGTFRLRATNDANSTGENAYLITRSGTSIQTHQWLTSGSERLRITSTGALNFTGAGTAGSTQAVSFNGSAPVNSLVIDSSGRLGVGSSSPQGLLDVRTDQAAATRIICNNASATTGASTNFDYYLGTTRLGGVVHGFGASAAYFGIDVWNGSAATRRLTIDASGNVGIGGTTSPNGLLDINNGAAVFSNSGTYIGGIGRANGLIGGTTSEIAITTSGAQGLLFGINNTEKARLDSSGRWLLGTSSARSNYFNASSIAPSCQIEGTTYSTSSISLIANGNAATVNPASYVILGRTRGTSVGSTTVVSSGDMLGGISYQGSDGTEFVEAGSILCEVDGTPGANDMPGRLVFSVTRDGSASPTEALRISNTGRIDTTSNQDVSGVVIANTNASFASTGLYFTATRAANSVFDLLAGYSSGTSDAEFRARGDGNTFCDGAFTGGGADYAEYFEWSDSNSNAEDRRGISVVLDGDKIREAQAGEDPIGVISGNPSVVGDAAWNKWSGKYLRDEYGTYILDANGDRQLNPAYDPDVEYISREERPEWDCVGLMGKLRIRKGQVTGSRWIKMRDINDSVEEWLVR